MIRHDCRIVKSATKFLFLQKNPFCKVSVGIAIFWMFLQPKNLLTVINCQSSILWMFCFFAVPVIGLTVYDNCLALTFECVMKSTDFNVFFLSRICFNIIKDVDVFYMNGLKYFYVTSYSKRTKCTRRLQRSVINSAIISTYEIRRNF